MSPSSQKTLHSLFEHLALPPKLPDKGDKDSSDLDNAIVERMLKCCGILRDEGPEEFRSGLQLVYGTLLSFKTLHGQGRLHQSSLKTAFSTLEQRNVLVIFVASQNAGLVIHTLDANQVVFEAFEASPRCADVLASTGALLLDFPATAAAIPPATFADPRFQEQLAIFLEKAGGESISSLAAKTAKAGTFILETRDTVEPSLIREMLITLVAANGNRVKPQALRKRIRDDVCWADGAEIPWRRSAFWLVMRVGIQHSLCRLFGGETGNVIYKTITALFLSRFCDEAVTSGTFLADSVALLRTKLARRMVKLHSQLALLEPQQVSLLTPLTETLSKSSHKTLKTANEKLVAEWAEIRKVSTKRVQRLPSVADPNSLFLSLTNSGNTLRSMLNENTPDPAAAEVIRLPGIKREAMFNNLLPPVHQKHESEFATLQWLTAVELWVAENLALYQETTVPSSDACSWLAEFIASYQKTALDVYRADPEQKSSMLLTIMELWIALDCFALKLFPLLGEYICGFPVDIMNPLYLTHLNDMRRLRKVESYLERRKQNANSYLPSVFGNPKNQCFAERYFDRSPAMEQLYQNLLKDGEKSRKEKEKEWRKKKSEYEDLVTQYSAKACIYTTDELQPLMKIHDRHCGKCFLERSARRIRIWVHEFPLPKDPVQAKAVVFELSCPKAFSAWRDSTWAILSGLARPRLQPDRPPAVLLGDYAQLKWYNKSKNYGLTLGSAKKSFLDTHYSTKGFPVDLEDICVPNALRFNLFDQQKQLWCERQTQIPNFSSICSLVLPKDSPFASLQFFTQWASDSGPTANEIIASQTRCPISLSVFEYLAFQDLRSGANLAWLKLLRELASSNLNFGAVSTSLIITCVALQSGPSEGDDPLRAKHCVFHDEAFCLRLIELVESHVTAISVNWRENQRMDCMIVLLLRTVSLSSSEAVRQHASRLLGKIREVTLGWVESLRHELHSAVEMDTVKRRSRDVRSAALLCRRTFEIEAHHAHLELGSEALRCFIECSIVLRDSSNDDRSSLPTVARNASVRDIKIVHRLEEKLHGSILEHHNSVGDAINKVWPEPHTQSQKTFTAWTRLAAPYQQWIMSTTVPSEGMLSQNIRLNLLEGDLLVDGRPVGRLPANYKNHKTLQEIFGPRDFMTYPSPIPGMTYAIANQIEGHQIHLGMRGEQLIMKARINRTTLQYVDSQIFRHPQGLTAPDIPVPLIEGHIHWLDLTNQAIEIRPRATMWQTKFSDWRLCLTTLQARRRNTILVDPSSITFDRIARIVAPFEGREQMIVYQPESSGVTLQLPRLELTFAVKNRGLLHSRQLRSVIDDNQDIGTFYGLDSKLVLRDGSNARERSVLVPVPTRGTSPEVVRRLRHVAVIIPHKGDYCRFSVNDLLKRLDSPAEPLFFYLKAFCHAVTSNILPDPLTGRTGVEEALQCLKSGYSQPWTPLNDGPVSLLLDIARLTPRREYYPTDLKVMQKVAWSPVLTAFNQHDGFRPLVESIFQKSDQLRIFDSNTPRPNPLADKGDSHLLLRAQLRHYVHQGEELRLGIQLPAVDTAYGSRNQKVSSAITANIFELVSLFRKWSCPASTTKDLVGTLERWSSIGGYHQPFVKVLLSGILRVDIAAEWGSIFGLCQRANRSDHTFEQMFLFSLLSFGGSVDMEILRTLVAVSINEDLKNLSPPTWPNYTHFQRMQIPTLEYLSQMLVPFRVAYAGDERSALAPSLTHKQRRQFQKDKSAHEEQTEADSKKLARHLLSQWPCTTPTLDGFSDVVLVDITRAMEVIVVEWERLLQNFELSNHVRQIQVILNSSIPKEAIDVEVTGNVQQKLLFCHRSTAAIPSLADLLRKPGPLLNNSTACTPETETEGVIEGLSELHVSSVFAVPDIHTVIQDINQDASNDLHGRNESLGESTSESDELQSIIKALCSTDNQVRVDYGVDLERSLKALRASKSKKAAVEDLVDATKLTQAIRRSTSAVQERFRQITAVTNHDWRFEWLAAGDLWPRVTTVTVLQYLSSTAKATFGPLMKESLIAYANDIVTLQRLLRIDSSISKGNTTQLADELSNAGHTSWSPLEYPDWILLEIESNLLIRTHQIKVAQAIIEPSSGSNCILQLNMGEGKSSCVIPMVTAVLADSRQLARVIVPKPLLRQTAQVLQSRIGGLLGRYLIHIPFSRRTSTTPETTHIFYRMQKECLEAQGVVLGLPEHLLSFKLSGIQRLSSGNIAHATPMINVQAWLGKKSRDILDESDHTLAVKTQLIYPSGEQKMIDGSPNRWKTVQSVLHLVDINLPFIQMEFSRAVEVVRRHSNAFPTVFFLRKEAEDALVERVVADICNGQSSILPLESCSEADKTMLKSFLRDAIVSRKTWKSISLSFGDKLGAAKDILLLRGLLVHRILLMALKKRWNVQYGLDPRRDPVAVPYHAKGVPSEQAEWGHPDVAILLTCLSFYYSGLSLFQLKQSLERILKSDDPSSEYDRLIQSASSLPSSLHSWNAVNLDDEAQCEELWKHLSHSMFCVDHFLNHFVFPKHAKQFETKLQASGWDIPLSRGSPNLLASETRGAGKENYSPHTITALHHPQHPKFLGLTTGFSGTNDNKVMLPLTIEQQDLPSLSHTNGEVLNYLLQPRNREYVCAAGRNNKRLSEKRFLRLLKDRNIRVLIDAGAQILELDNQSLAKAWLLEDNKSPAAVYLDNDGRPWIRYRDGHGQPLAASPYADNLGECLVYLDEAHTRGTDLKLPAMAKGALTIGPEQTKDATVQAAMRLRQLGTTQSVVFFAPPEVHQSILDFRGQTKRFPIDSRDVIGWLLEQTCRGIERLQPLYTSQGMDFCKRTQAAITNKDHLVREDERATYLNALEHPERYSLEQLYAPKSRNVTSTSKLTTYLDPKIAAYASRLQSLRESFCDNGDAVQASAHQEVEQEREVAIEVEAVREVQKPSHATPLPHHPLHRDVVSFAERGRLVAGSSAYEQIFVLWRRTAAGLKARMSEETESVSKILATVDFANTVSLQYGQPMDMYQRPVNWILWSPVSDTAIIISPFEAEHVLPIIRNANPSRTHLIVYAAPVTRSMVLFNNLDFYSIPALPSEFRFSDSLVRDLGFFAGRLYFQYKDYSSLCTYLAIQRSPSPSHAESSTTDSEEIGRSEVAPFGKSPLAFLQEWLSIRRHGQDFTYTPMGYVCQGRRLVQDHPFFGGGVVVDDEEDADECTSEVTDVDVKSTHGGAEEFGGDPLD